MDIYDISDTGDQPTTSSVGEQSSPYQEAIYSAFKDPFLNIIIQASAGSGKSTTLRGCVKHATGRTLMMAFGRDIALDLKSKVGKAADVKTFNGLGHMCVNYNARSAELDDRKVSNVVRGILGEGTEDYKNYGYTVRRLVSLMKSNAFGIPGSPLETFTLDDIKMLVDSYSFDIPFERLEEFASKTLLVFKQQLAIRNCFDYDDQLYWPLLYNWRFLQWDNVLVDEAQDLNPIQHLMIQKLYERGGRIVAVGDRSQAIYGFRGALANSMDLMKQRFSMKEYPLAVSYRCPLSVVREARKYCDHIEARPDAPEGSVLYRGLDDLGRVDLNAKDPHLFGPGVLVLSRNNAPLFKAILRHVREKEPCHVLSNFLDSFQSFIRNFRCEDTIVLQDKLEAWFLKEKEEAEKKNFRGKIASLRDKYETCKLLASEFKTVSEMLSIVEKLSKSTSGATFSTIHKAKGLESEQVYILRPDTMPSPFAVTEEAKVQENNLIYVAVTRSKMNLEWGVPLI